MTMIQLSALHGSILRDESHLLRDGVATFAKNCDVRTGAIQSLIAPLAVSSIASAVRSLYTIDGLQFFTWTTTAFATKAPTIGDLYDRIYYADTTGPRVTQIAQMTTSGGSPVVNWRLGVPVPIAGTATVANAATLPDGMTLAAKFWYESAGVRYQEQVVALTQVTLGREYTFPLPARDQAGDTAGRNVVITHYNGTSVGTLDSPHQAIILGTNSIQLLPEGTIVTGVTTISTDAAVTNPTLSTMYNAVAAADKTPTGAVPTLLIEASVAGSVVFSAYSDGSSFVRSDQPVKIMLKEDSPTVLRAVIEWGGNGLIGNTQARETAAYVITLVNVFGEESGPSLPVVVTKDYLQNVTLGYTLDASISQYVPCTKLRFYKTVAGAGSDYFMCDEISFTATPGSFTQLLSNNAIAQIGPTLESTTRVPPPTDCKGALVTGFGSILLWRTNELWPSEMYRGHAFSPDYVVTFPNNIVTVRSTAFGILVWTTAGVYIVNGSNPRALLPVRLPVRQTVVNDLAIAVYENTVIYASPDGLVVIQGSDASLGGFLKIMTRQQWRSRYSARFSSLVLAAHDGYIVGLFSSGDGFLIRMDEDVGDFVEHSITGLGAFYFPQTDQLYIGQPAGISIYNEGVPLSWQWYSKEFRVGKPVNMGAFEACGFGAMIVVLLGDDVVLATFAITLSTKGTLQRLPTGNKSQHYRLQFNALAGSILTGFRLCEIPAELAGV